MKKILFILTLVLATSAFGQKNFGANLGMTQGAFNLGASVDSSSDTGKIGGSFFLQTEKEEGNTTIVNQILTFGAHVVMNVIENNNWALDLRPGVNISMINDVRSNSGGKDDKTVIGPSLRWSVTHRLASNNEIGIEHLEVWNWLEDDVDSNVAFTTFVFRSRF